MEATWMESVARSLVGPSVDLIESPVDDLWVRDTGPTRRADHISETYAPDEFAAGYIGFYACNTAVIMQAFGDAQADLAAKQALQRAFPDRGIEQDAIDGIAAGGGSIHCSTQQAPQVRWGEAGPGRRTTRCT